MSKKFLDSDGLLYVLTKIKTALSGKVDAVAGKQLSTNDYTDEDKQKLASLSEATSSDAGLMSSTDKAKLDAFSSASSYVLKSDVVNAYVYKGSVANMSLLPSNADNGDVYNVEADGMNYAWTGTAWDALGGSFAVDAMTNTDIDAIFAT